MRRPRSHGFYRFFAFESILILFLLNVDYWFADPFSVVHIISWLLLISSIFMVAQGFYLLHTMGRPEHGIENTKALVTRGIYKYVRHPLYSSLLLLVWGVFFKNTSLLSTILVIVTSMFLIVTAKVEEAENLQKFGAEYNEYMKTTKMFIPFLF